MSTQDTTRPGTPQARLEYAIVLAKSGQKTEAAEILRQLVALQPVNQAAWMWLSAVTKSADEGKAALAQARNIDPNHPSLIKAEQWWVHRFSPTPETKVSPVSKNPTPDTGTPKTPPPTAKKQKNWFGLFNSLALGVAVAILLAGLLVFIMAFLWEIGAAAQPAEPQQPTPTAEPVIAVATDTQQAMLDAALAQQNWPEAITILKQIHGQEPETVPIKQQLGQLYVQQGMTLRNKGLLDEALPYFKDALAMSPQHTLVRQEFELAEQFLAGSQSYQHGQWGRTITHLNAVWTKDNHYPNVADLLYSAYYNQGLAQQAAADFINAKTSFEAAIALRPDLSQPYKLLTKVEFAMAPQTELETPLQSANTPYRLIIVGVAEQQMLVYEHGQPVFDFVISTGEPGRDTAIGEFEILNKIDIAYAATWNLDMPYWMGIYWAGPLQNGIHSLPIVKHTGYKLWDGYLGQRVSYGCVILSDEDAATLYNWTEIGTKVKIVPSLANWSIEEEMAALAKESES